MHLKYTHIYTYRVLFMLNGYSRDVSTYENAIYRFFRKK